jgi:hypothetical protein
MSDHSRAFVPVDTGAHSSPELTLKERSVDTGLLAEALVYYDQVLFNVTNAHQFADLVSWLIQQGLPFERLLDLLREETLRVYYYAFYTLPFVNDNVIDLWNINDKVMQKPNSFAERFLNFDGLRRCFADSRQMDQFCAALDGRVIEVKAEEFGGDGIANAWRDFLDPRRSALIVQELVDELYRLGDLGRPPEVRARINPSAHQKHLHHVEWNVDFAELAKLVGPRPEVGPTLPLSMAAVGNKYIWSASKQGCDLYLPSPISAVVGDKLFEADRAAVKTGDVIDQLQAEVEFPDLRRLVNGGQVDFKQVLEIRAKAGRFRQWLQSESERDRNAIIAYHNEVARESGLLNAGRKVLRMFGAVGGAAAGAAIGAVTQDGAAGATVGAAIGGAAGEGIKYLLEIGSRIGGGWKPVAFGNWYKNRIERLLGWRDH